MHAFHPGPFPAIFWIAVVVIVLCAIFIHVRGRFWNDNGRWSLYVPAALATLAAAVAIVSGGAWWFLV